MTTIEWTEKSWNPVVGCTITSPGCTNCYAMGQAARLLDRPGSHYEGTTRRVNGKAVWTGKVAMAPDHILTAPLRRRRPTTWFVNSMGDLFHEDVPDAWIDRVFAVMALAPQHTFQVLTKQAKRMRDYLSDERRPYKIARALLDMMLAGNLPKAAITDETWPVESEGDIDFPDDVLLRSWPLPNVWLGVSAEDQTRANDRLKYLIATPAAVRFVSAEPLLAEVDLTHWFHAPMEMATRLHWVIVGGESGPGARPMHPDWARSIRDQCAAAGVPFFFKQWGEYVDCDQLPDDYIASNHPLCVSGGNFTRLGKKRTGRLLDGRTHDAMPGRAG